MSNPKAKKTANPFRTRNDRTRLGPLNMHQLHELLERESRAKTRGKIQNRINELVRRGIPLPQKEI
jgi:hypothetical protein